MSGLRTASMCISELGENLNQVKEFQVLTIDRNLIFNYFTKNVHSIYIIILYYEKIKINFLFCSKMY